MNSYIAGNIARAIIEKGGLMAFAIFCGFGLLAYILKQGLEIIKKYADDRDRANSDLIAFIKLTQARQDQSQASFLGYTQEMNKTISAMSTTTIEGHRLAEGRHGEVLGRFNKLDNSHEEIIKDIWRGRAE